MYLSDLLSGNIKHWNITNASITYELLQALEDWEKREEDRDKLAAVLRTFLALQHVIFKRFFLRGFLKPYFKQLKKPEFKDLNGIMLCFTCSWFVRSNPSLKALLLSALEFLFSEWRENYVSEIVKEFESVKYEHLPFNLYMKLYRILKKELKSEWEITENYDYENWMKFYFTWAKMYKTALDELQQKNNFVV